MIQDIAYELVKNLSTKILYLDKWAGLVVPMKKSVGGREKIIPVALQMPSDCDPSDYIDLVPDSKKQTICYCEKIGEATFEPHGYYSIVSVNLRIVLWYNLNKITAGKYVGEDVILSNLYSQIPRSLKNYLFTNARSVSITKLGTTTGAEIFSQYTYDEVRTQFVTFPYGAVAVNVNVQFVATDCEGMLIPAEGCVMGAGNHSTLTEPQLAISPNSFEVTEHQAIAGRISATYGSTYSIVGGADSALLTVHPTAGILTFLQDTEYDTPGDANADNTYELIVSATKGTTTVTQPIIIKVTDMVLSPQWPITAGEKRTGVDAGILNQISITDDYIYFCVLGGVAGVAIWKKSPVSQSY